MLILTRLVGQSIQIGDDVVVEVVEVQESPGRQPKVRLGITAPASINILRTELSVI